MNAPGELIETLVRSETFQRYQRAFTEATAMELHLRPIEAPRSPCGGRRTEAARGLCEASVPVRVGAQTIGLLHASRALRRKPAEASFPRSIHQARQLDVDIAEVRTKQAFFATPVVSRPKLEAVSDLLTVFADHLAMISNQVVVQSAHAAPPMLARALQIIHAQYAENLSLRGVSRIVHASPAYLCRLFRKHTTFTFTELVSRTRVEQAKQRLLNPHIRVSEIAFAVGFQSLPQFNRAFRNIVGQSPTGYRDDLPAAA